MQFLESISLSEFIAIDLETSGLNPKEDKIIEISAYKFCNGKPMKSFTKLVNPQIKLSNTTTQITGIRDEMLINQPIFDEIKDDFISFIGDLPIVGHNVIFDLSFLENNLNNYNQVFNERMICDTFYLSKLYYYYLNSFSLSAICQNLSISVNNAHRAEEDAKNSGLLFVDILINQILKTKLSTMQKINNCIQNYNVPNKELFSHTLSYLLKSNSDFKGVNNNVPLSSLDYSYNKTDKIIDISINDLFSDDGILKKKFKKFEVRREQVNFCEDIYNNFKNKSILVAEAGAGLGKSYAYLFGSLLYSKNNKSQIIISTNTHNLQDQLFYKDLPFVLDILEYDCKVTIIKGMNNYICRTRLDEILNNIKNNLNGLETLEIISLLYWLDNTLTGDISECNGFNKKRYSYLWLLINAKSEYCLTHRCNRYDGCYYRQIRDLASLSDILIVNHSMLVSYYDNNDSFINDNSICIVDECHNFHSICQKQLSNQVTPQLFKEHKSDYLSILNSLKKNKLDSHILLEGNDMIRDFDSLYKQFSNLCYDIFQDCILSPIQSEYEQNLSLDNENIFLNDQICKDFLSDYNSAIKKIRDYKKIINNYNNDNNIKYDLMNIELLVNNMDNYYSIIKDVMSPHDNTINWFSYIYYHKNLQKMSFNSAPGKLDEITYNIFSKFNSSVFCSATLSTDSGFDFFIRQMGMQDLVYSDNIKLSKYSSPYFYQEQSKIFVINAESDLKHIEHIKKVANDIIDLSISTNKRMLVLCTSFKQIYDFQNILKLNSSVKNRCLFQVKGTSKAILLTDYLSKENSILFGTNTFWEGIDLPNDKLEILIIFKLPFSNPNDPYVKANIEYYQSKNLDAFTSYQLQDTILKLRQGFGRLIRSYEDMGICIITDPRITRRRYGHHILNSLPVESKYYSSVYQVVDSVKKFLK
tara:strand:+ start:40167 stop:42941 length:2775 start_codon:yes stop_codon:yes gene_type:complete